MTVGDFCQIILAIAVFFYGVHTDRISKREEKKAEQREIVTRTIEAYTNLYRDVLSRFELYGTGTQIEDMVRKARIDGDEKGHKGYASETYKKIKQDVCQIDIFASALYKKYYSLDDFMTIANPDFGNNIAPRLNGFFKGANLKSSTFYYARKLVAETHNNTKERFSHPNN